MSRRLISLLKVHLHIERTYNNPPIFLHPSFLYRQLRTRQPPAVTRTRTISNKAYGRSVRTAMKNVSDEYLLVLPAQEAEACATFGFSPTSLKAIRTILLMRARYALPPRQSHDFLQNYVQWAANTMTIPSPIRRAEQHFLTELMPLMLEAGGITLNQIGEHRAEDMLQALNVMGTQSMTSAFDDENMEQSEKRIHMQGACYLLEVAVIYGNLESATRLLKFAANQGVQKLGVGINTNDAWQLVKANVADSRNPEECPWQAVSVYMEREFSLANLRSATPRARAWAIELLQYAGGQVLPGDEVESVHEWALFENPWSVLLGLVDQCLKYSLAVETYTRQQLQRLRLSCLRELTQYNDVAACFEVATRNEEFSSTEWVRMMTCAAADGQPDACWMLAIYYWQRDGLLATNEAQPRSGHVAKGKTSSPGFDWAEAALFAQQDRPPVLLSRAVASAALFRSLDDLESGSVLLQNIVSHIEHLNWVPLALRRRFETVLEDYRAKEDPAGIWAPQQCLSQIKRITDTSPEVTRNMGIPAEWLPKP